MREVSRAPVSPRGITTTLEGLRAMHRARANPYQLTGTGTGTFDA